MFLRDYPEYIGLIMIGLARCIAMVIVWNDLAKGDTEYAAGLVAFNASSRSSSTRLYAWLFITVLPPLIGLRGRGTCQGLHRGDRQERLHLPRHPLPRRHADAACPGSSSKGRDWYERLHPAHQPADADRLAVHDRGDVLAQGRRTSSASRWTCVRIAVPLLIYFVVMFLVSF